MALVKGLKFLGIICCVAIGFGCDLAPQPKLRVGLLVWPAYEFGFLAQQQFQLDERIELIDYLSPAVAARDFRSGAIDAVALTTNYALELAATDPTVRIVLAIDESTGGDAIVGLPAHKSMSGLQGQRVGVEASALGAYVLARALALNGLGVADIQVVPVDLGDQERLFNQGSLAAVTTYEPIRGRLLENGGNELFNSAELSGEILDVLITNTRVMREHHRDLQQFVDGWFGALALYQAMPATYAEYLGKREGLSGAQFREVLAESAILFDLQDNRALFTGETSLANHLGEVHRHSLDADLLKSEIAFRLLVEPRFVDSAVPLVAAP